ncbi:M48 family metallopeptidase [Desulfopila inferna]|uniref:M48 family metallopeptidase n=1 Tax=Desulfopila inferna TaxID=468528 RepID=UPI001963284E|nr:SprT family zinc-dependent metalloprotease [Desulfopila inferna]MBM9605682.1 M48 family metallopeptidase [Desulfopila inferna]
MKPLNYTIIRRTRRKTVSIVVRPDKTVQIVVPAALSENEIARIAERKRRWIVAKLGELGNCDFEPVEHLYLDGEFFLFMGKQYRLTVADGRGRVNISGNRIETTVPAGLTGDDRRKYLQERLVHFFVAQALEILRKKSCDFGSRYGFEPPFVGIKNYTSRWGCCFGDGRIYFNWKIIMAPERIIDYVVIHELCHLREPNHSWKYWAVVEKIMPDWKERRIWLRRNGHSLTF